MNPSKTLLIVALLLLLLLVPSFSLNKDGVLLLSFRYAILNDPLSLLDSWNYDDATPCSWTGVTCSLFADPPSPDPLRVTAVVFSGSKLLGSIPQELGQIEHLRHLDLSGNLFNGTLPDSILNSTQLEFLSLAGNMISGELPASVGQMKSLKLLNISGNAFTGKAPETLPQLKNLTVVSLRSNHFSGDIPAGFDSVEVLDLSSNMFSGTLPLDFGGGNLRYLNLSSNKISGSISPEFAHTLPANSTIDLSFNNLTGPIPEFSVLMNQKTESFTGNGDLCGKPLKALCSIPSTLSSPPNKSTAVSPAIAVLPRTVGSDPETDTPGGTGHVQNQTAGMRPGTLAAIAVTNLAGIAILGMVILFVYQHRKRKNLEKSQLFAAKSQKRPEIMAATKFDFEAEKSPPVSSCCLNMKQEQSAETTSSSDSSDLEEKQGGSHNNSSENYKKRGQLVTVDDGETELELEKLLKASAYILGTSGSSIVYKAVLEGGTAVAVRRIGESSLERLRDFEAQVRAIAKLKHPNLVKVRGFYWGEDEKLLISDYISNGSLAAFSAHRSSPCHHMSLEVRLKIAKGVGRGLAFIHEKKQVHANIKPSNILLSSEMEALIADLGLHVLISGKSVFKPSNSSARFLSSYYPTPSPGTRPHDHNNLLAISSPYASSSAVTSPYQAPEFVQNVKPNSKWDVYSFGVMLLELLSGRVFPDRQMNRWSESGSIDEDVNRVLRFLDVEAGREDVVVGCFRLGLRCVALVPQKRPSMREALQILEKLTTNILWV